MAFLDAIIGSITILQVGAADGTARCGSVREMLMLVVFE